MKKPAPHYVGTESVERLSHFSCGFCGKWWSMGDAPRRRTWHCPWCGRKQDFKVQK